MDSLKIELLKNIDKIQKSIKNGNRIEIKTNSKNELILHELKGKKLM